MVIKAISALRLAVADVDRSLAFYTKLGFQDVPTEGSVREVRSNWFRIRLESRGSQRGSEGLRVCISVDDVDEFAAFLASKGVEARREPAGKGTELVVTDPDNYTLLFFQTKGAAQKSERSHQPRS
jgi:catechol 2,3-dioxygenase-like lactoylglutathione lyase family enzyme